MDGGVELFRCFHGAPRAEHDGHEVGATRGLLQSLAALLRRDDLTHVAVAFDPMAPDPRDPLLCQVGLALDAVRALGIAVWPLYRAQADDGLATGAARWSDDVDRVVLCTTDRDLLQCVRGVRVIVWDRVRKRELDEAYVHSTYGVSPPRLPDFFALVGMPQKGLPGVPGWGPKAAAEALSRNETLERVVEDASIRPRLRDALRDRVMEAVLQRNCVALRTDLPVPHELDDLRWRAVDRPRLEALCDRIGDRSVLGVLPADRSP